VKTYYSYRSRYAEKLYQKFTKWCFCPINRTRLTGSAMTKADLEVKRKALCGWLVGLGGTCHVTAMLAQGTSLAVLEDRIREWSNRVNRYFLGSRWWKPHHKDNRMSGVVFFEIGEGGWHAHMILKPPQGVSPLKFLMRAPHWFRPHPGHHVPNLYGKPVTLNGKMLVQIIDGPESARKVAKYDTKELQYHDDAMSSWKFIDHLVAYRRP
jgi:hypothetical protein